MRRIPQYHLLIACLLFVQEAFSQTPINRKQLVERHTIVNTKVDPLASVSIGNGVFAFTADITGLQSFPAAYTKGVPLGTQSEWGWHSFVNDSNFRFEESLRKYHLNGRDVPYSVQWSAPDRNKNASNYFRQSVHRLQLGNIGFEFLKKDGTPAAISDLRDIHQELNMWTGEIKSHFTLEGTAVDVSTFAHQQQDAIAMQVRSALIQQGRLHIRIRLPYPTGNFDDDGNNWVKEDKHQSTVTAVSATSAVIAHTLDTTTYFIRSTWNGAATIKEKSAHYFLLTPVAGNAFECTISFEPNKKKLPLSSYGVTKANSLQGWKSFWMRGGAVDFSGSTDQRAVELERRIILSQYLTKIQCAGNYPPQETGLTYNSWYGKPHLEMHWWHAVHFALWGRIDLLEKSLNWYAKVQEGAKQIAQRQGYDGVRWQKMTDNAGRESPSSVGAFLIWQQPHFIYFAELCYRQYKDAATLQRYKDLVFATADFMASYAYFDAAKGKYILGKGLIPAQERFKAEETFNPTYELAYWQWALTTAQQWRKRLHLPENKKWNDVLQQLSPLPVQDGVYLATESATDSYTNKAYKTDHPSVLGTWGMLPATPLLDTTTMRRTFNLVWTDWEWADTWGWDFPMTAMTATRLGLPEKAIDALFMPVKTNTYLRNGHNYQDERLRLYLPGNGGLLIAIAMMCGGYDGATVKQPGIPTNGKWKVRSEGFYKMP
jgi:protein-glucosylgalactosylhydroxylysine glucosidase